MRAMGIALHFRERVVLAMHRHPLLRADAGRDPQAEPEDKSDGGMQLEGLVRGAAMEKDGRAEHGDLRHERRCEQAPE